MRWGLEDAALHLEGRLALALGSLVTSTSSARDSFVVAATLESAEVPYCFQVSELDATHSD